MHAGKHTCNKDAMHKQLKTEHGRLTSLVSCSRIHGTPSADGLCRMDGPRSAPIPRFSSLLRPGGGDH